jgi:hypothetical protein
MRIKLLRNIAGPELTAGGHFADEIIESPRDLPDAMALELVTPNFRNEVYALEVPDET